jgi:hypothetical protein
MQPDLQSEESQCGCKQCDQNYRHRYNILAPETAICKLTCIAPSYSQNEKAWSKLWPQIICFSVARCAYVCWPVEPQAAHKQRDQNYGHRSCVSKALWEVLQCMCWPVEPQAAHKQRDQNYGHRSHVLAVWDPWTAAGSKVNADPW